MTKNRVTGNFYTVRGSSTSAREGLMPLADRDGHLAKRAIERNVYRLRRRFRQWPNRSTSSDNRRAENKNMSAMMNTFQMNRKKITETALRPFYRQSKYYSPGYNKQTNNSFYSFL